MTGAVIEPKNHTVLIVDDEELLREAVAFDFRRRGYKVLTASSGNGALKILEKNRADVVISDVRMADGTGIEMLIAIKNKNVFSPAVILITGFADLRLEDAYDFGADAVFPKPFNRQALREAVERALQPINSRFNRKAVRVGSILQAELNSSSISRKITQIMNFGRGGFFAAILGELPPIGDIIEFSINLEEDTMKITGTGIVRWLRKKSSDPQRAAGCGIEFLSIDSSCRRAFLEHLNFSQTKAFIPIK